MDSTIMLTGSTLIKSNSFWATTAQIRILMECKLLHFISTRKWIIYIFVQPWAWITKISTSLANQDQVSQIAGGGGDIVQHWWICTLGLLQKPPNVWALCVMCKTLYVHTYWYVHICIYIYEYMYAFANLI